MIFTAIGTAIAGALFGGSVLAATVIAGGLAYGASMLWQQINRPKARTYSAVQGEVQYGANVPVGALYGVGKVRGHKAFYAKYGAGNKFNAEVFLLSNGWCDGLEPSIIFEGARHTLVARARIGNEVAHYGVSGFDNLISIRFYDGRPGQQADMKLVADSAALGQTWKATSVCAGMAYVVVERQYDEGKFKTQPEFDFIMRGLREYDPRKDSTVAGGSGPHRLNNPATWEFSRNPALHRLNYQLGIRGLRSGRTIIGEGKSLGQLDLGSYIAAMNACDTIRNGKSTYQASLYVTGNDDHTEILREFDDAMAGYALNRRGLSGVIAGAPQIPVATITPNDIPVGRAQEIKRRKSAFELYNHMSGQFTSIDALWTPDSLNPVYVNADVAADGRPRQTSNDFLQVTDPNIAQYLLNIRYRQNRKGGSATVPVSRRLGLKVQEGEWVAFDGKQWLITGWRCDSGMRVTLSLSETGADVYSEAGITPGPIVIPSTPPVNPSVLSVVQDFDVQVGFINGSNGQEAPALRFTWKPPNDPTIIAVRFFYFIGTDPTGKVIYEDQTTDVEAGAYTTTKNIAPGVLYTARATITTVPDRLKTYTLWITTPDTTGPFKFLDEAILDELGEAITEKVVELDEWARFNTRETIERNRKALLLNVEGAVGAYKDRKAIRQQASSTWLTSRAEWTNDILVATGPGSAIVTRIEELRTEVFDPVSGLPATTSLVNLLSAEVRNPTTGLEAIGNAILQLDSTVGKFSANGLLRIQTVANTTGAVATAALGVVASDGATMGNAALYLRALSDGSSEAYVVANRFAVRSSPSGPDYGLFAVDSGVVWIDEARIRNLTAANVATRSLTADKIAAGSLTSAEINVAQLVASNAFISNLVVRTANIADLTIGRDKIADGAFADYIGPGTTSGSGNSVTYTSSDFVAGAKPVFMCVSAQVNRAGSPDGSVSVFLDGVSAGTSISIGGSASTQYLSIALMRLLNNGQTYRLRLVVSNSGTQGSISVTEVAFGGMIPRK